MPLRNTQALPHVRADSARRAKNPSLLFIIFIVMAITTMAVITYHWLQRRAVPQVTASDKGSPTNLPLNAGARSQSIADPTLPTRTKYLLFQELTADVAILGQPDTPHTANKILMRRFADELLTAIGQRGDHVNRQLGIVIGPLSWDLTDDQIRTVIRDAFAVAEEKGIAIGFHIDDSMFWNKRKDLWSNKNNVEWSDWTGTIVPHRVIGFIPNPTELAPPMCYNSPAIIAETSRRAHDVIGSEIKKGIDHLKLLGKSYLFAGVIAGWETRMQDDSYPPVYYGYCALHNLGYSASHPPSDMDKALERVVADWIALWAKNLERAGIPREMVFMHIAYPGELSEGIASRLRQAYSGRDAWRDFYKSASPRILGLKTYANPGFSIYGVSSFKSLYKVLASYGNPPWAICEGTDIDLSNAFSNLSIASTFTSHTRYRSAAEYAPSASMEQYLGDAFNHGAVFVNLFGWEKIHEKTAFARATMGAPAINAYQKFLKGEPLAETAASTAPLPADLKPSHPPLRESATPPSDQVQQLSQTMQMIQHEVPAWVQTHRDRAPELAALFRQLDSYARVHDVSKAQQTANEILRMIRTPSPGAS